MEFEVCLDAVEAYEASLRVRPEALDAIDGDRPVGEGVALLAVLFDAEMLVVADIDKPVIALPAIGRDDALRTDLASE